MYRRADASRATDGQSTVEFALLLPVVAFMLAALFEVAMLLSDDARVAYAAREAARAAAVDPDEEAVEAAARRSGLEELVLEVSPSPVMRAQGEPVTVRVAYKPSGRLPLAGLLSRTFTLRAEARMRIERP
jgi:Flp pilus assembly protein TadG